MKVYSHTLDEASASKSPIFVQKFCDWSRRTLGVIDEDFLDHIDYLSLCQMNATKRKPPSFALIGRHAAARGAYGDDWADNVKKSQKTPISKLDTISAPGYTQSLALGCNYDIVKFEDDKTKGAFHRFITPIRMEQGDVPKFFAMLAVFDEFERKDGEPNDQYSHLSSTLTRNQH